MAHALRVAIAGGGLGGLFAAATLARLGHEVSVHERAERFEEIGAGVQMSPNASRLLRRIDALSEVEAAAFRPEAAELRLGRSGATVLHLPLGDVAEARWGSPYLNVHRADLLAALERSARAAGVRLELGASAAGAESDGGSAALRLDTGEEVEADLVIGADGSRSAIREAIQGPAPARYTGQTAWRGLVSAEALPPGLIHPAATVWAGVGRHLVTYHLRRGALVNFVAVVEEPVWKGEDWRTAGDVASLREAFEGWAPGAAAVLAAAESCSLWGLFDRPPLASWRSGRITLLGDACHPMLPFMAQGAAQAFEDGAALALSLTREKSPEAALRRYEHVRKPRATRVQRMAWSNARLFHARPGVESVARYAPIAIGARLAPRLALSQLDWLYGHDAGA